ncbi:DUF1398 family protein, partial [Staphylococcus saprophyticus]|uniref:DUF1398 family protein n=1 Tax=Staphylococcus saprophyticus TaxID=29385 RepID=UPI0011A1E481
ISDESVKVAVRIGEERQLGLVKDILERDQAGERDFGKFWDEMVGGGIYKWDIDIMGGRCGYIEKENEVVIRENIGEC